MRTSFKIVTKNYFATSSIMETQMRQPEAETVPSRNFLHECLKRDLWHVTDCPQTTFESIFESMLRQLKSPDSLRFDEPIEQ